MTTIGNSPLHPADLGLAQQLVIANRILVERGIVDGFGHVSVRSASDHSRFLIARNIAPALAQVEDVQLTDLDGETDDPRPGYLERFIHAEIYRARPDVQAIVHSHSPSVVPFSVAERPLRPVLHMAGFLAPSAPVFEIRDVLGDDSDLLIRDRDSGAALAEVLGEGSVALMRGHGSTVVGPSLPEAVFRAVYTEVNAKAQLSAEQLGIRTFLTESESREAAATIGGQVRRAWDYWRGLAARLESPPETDRAYDIRTFYVTGDWHGMYVEHWAPRGRPRGRIVLLHGGGETGAFFTGTPDRPEGWAQYLVGAGWELYLTDWPGTGRSGTAIELQETSAQPIIDAHRRLLARVGRSALIGHSIGGTLSLKLAELDPELVAAIVGVNSGPAGNVHTDAPPADPSRVMMTSRERLAAMFATSERFPADHFDEYVASRVAFSPRVYNQLGARIGDELVLHDVEAVRRVPTMLVVAEGDHMVPMVESAAQAELVGAELRVLDRDWGLPGFGHLVPIERGTRDVVARIETWLAEHVVQD